MRQRRAQMLDYVDVGSGEAMVFVHAGIADRTMWQPQVDGLANKWRVVCPDLRGFGSSGHHDEPYRHSWDVAEVLDCLALSDVVVVGASMGGAACIDLALERPDLVRSLVLVGAVYDGFRFEDEDLLSRWGELGHVFETGDLDKTAAEEADIWIGEGATADVQRQVIAMVRRSYDHGEIDQIDVAVPAVDRLNFIDVPTLVLVGDQDRPDIRRAAEELSEQIPNTKLSTIPGATHLPSLEQPHLFNEILTDFVETNV